MSAPDRIWIDGAVNANVWAGQKTDCTLSGVAAYEYVRADLCDPVQDERVRALVDEIKLTCQFLDAKWCVHEGDTMTYDALDILHRIASIKTALRDMGVE